MGWVGNVLILVGLWLLGSKNRLAFIFTFAGEAIWVVHAARQELVDLAAICAVFGVLAVRNWYAWGKQ